MEPTEHIEFGRAKVTLLTHTPEPEKLCAAAARLCTLPGSILEDYLGRKKLNLQEDNDAYTRDGKLIRKVLASGHHSVAEHPAFTFLLEDVSRAATHQLVRHRVGCSFSQQSQRYIPLDLNTEPIIPRSIANNTRAKEIFLAAHSTTVLTYKELVEECEIPEEDARGVAMNAQPSRIMVTMNGRELLHFFKLRCCMRAQEEIRTFANLMLHDCIRIAPYIFEGAGASCRTGCCPEGVLGCKQINEKRINL